MSVEGLILRARKHAGLTQAQLAERLGIAYQSISDAENKTNPSVGLLARYGEAMGLTLEVRYVDLAVDPAVAPVGSKVIIE